MDMKKHMAFLGARVTTIGRMYKNFVRDTYGFMRAVNQVIGLGLVAIILILMVMVFAKIEPTTESGLTGAALQAVQNISSNTYSGFQLASITPTVMAAGVVIMVILSFVGYMYFGQQQQQ